MNTPDSMPAPLTYETPSQPHATSILLGYVGLKLLELYLLANMISQLGSLVYFVTTYDQGATEWPQILAECVHPVISGLLGATLIIYALSLSKWLFCPLGAIGYSADVTSMVAVASVAVGLLIMGQSLNAIGNQLIVMLAEVRQRNASFNSTGGPTWWDYGALISVTAQFAIGAVLFLRPNWIVGAWHKHSRMPDSCNISVFARADHRL